MKIYSFGQKLVVFTIFTLLAIKY